MSTEKSLRNITVNSPCLADWDQMVGNDQVRFCEHCNLTVHNISELTRVEAARLVERSQGRLCVRYYRDATGRLITSESPHRSNETSRLHQIGRRVSRLTAGAFSATLSFSTAVAQNSMSLQKNATYSGRTQTPANSTSGSTLIGTITDPNGAVIAGASVAIFNESSNLSLYTSTNDAGEFRFEELASGVYNVRIEAPGFAPTEAATFLSANGETHIDRSLSVATIEEEVTIGSGQTETVTMGVVAMVSPSDPFIKAAQEDNLEEVSRLIAGRNVNLRDPSSHTTALEHAVENGNREMTQLLLAAGASVTLENEAGVTPLMLLSEDATTDLVWDLINAGADVNHKDNSGRTPLLSAASTNNVEALKTLLDAGANVNSRNKDGQTALMRAASEGLINNVRALILAGAELSARDADDKDALSYAINNEHSAVVRFLRSEGAVETVTQVKEEN